MNNELGFRSINEAYRQLNADAQVFATDCLNLRVCLNNQDNFLRVIQNMTPKAFLANSYTVVMVSGLKVATSLKRYLDDVINRTIHMIWSRFVVNSFVASPERRVWRQGPLSRAFEQANKLRCIVNERIVIGQAIAEEARAKEAQAVANPVAAGTFMPDAAIVDAQGLAFMESLNAAIASARSLGEGFHTTRD
jgi:hypothetical protein